VTLSTLQTEAGGPRRARSSRWEVPGSGATPSAPGGTTYPKKNKLHLFVRGTDNKIYVNRLTPSR
jgi:hypothetical protein